MCRFSNLKNGGIKNQMVLKTMKKDITAVDDRINFPARCINWRKKGKRNTRKFN